MSIAFTLGEPAGIGVDLAVLYAQQKSHKDLLIFSDPDLLKSRAKILNLDLKIVEKETSKQYEVCVYPVKTKTKVEVGKLNPKNAEFVLKTLDLATQHCLDKKSSALITAPIHKAIISQSGVNFSGHTEYFARLTNSEVVMMLACENLRVALVTTHLPLQNVSQNINAKSLEKTIIIIYKFLQKNGIKTPKIVICGLNPHAGEDGCLGYEEQEIINPLIAKMRQDGYDLEDAKPADTAFTPDALKGVDTVLCMYHDQGLPVLKALGFKRAVNITLGLPFIRTSVAHGTALDLAGSGKISLGSLNYALDYTQKLIAKSI